MRKQLIVSMTESKMLIVSVFFCIACLMTASVVHCHDDGAGYQLRWATNQSTAASFCSGSIAECGEGRKEEFQMDSETNRRILATTTYISYGALSRNRVPCSQRGASYYNCQTGAQANPYSRGCSAITQCRA